jgi:uncharacterized protein (TIGR02996 family)
MTLPLHLQQLFQAVYDAPQDSSRREVLADALLEQGEARGEFISLQLDGASRSRKRAAKLLKRHRQAFLGPLADTVVPGTDEWQGGFLIGAAATLSGARVEERAWSTVERLVVVLGPKPPLELASAHFRSLRQIMLTPLTHLNGRRQENQTWERQQRALEAVRLLLLEGRRPQVLMPGAEWRSHLRA